MELGGTGNYLLTTRNGKEIHLFYTQSTVLGLVARGSFFRPPPKARRLYTERDNYIQIEILYK